MTDFDELARDHAEMVRTFNRSPEESMDEAVAMLIQATANKEWQAAVNQTWPSKPATDRITLEGMQRMKRLMIQPKRLAFLVDTPRNRAPVARLEYAHVNGRRIYEKEA